MAHALTYLPVEKKIIYRITWPFDVDPNNSEYTFESDEFNSPFHEHCYWKLDFHWEDGDVYINLKKLSPEIVVDDFEGAITMHGDPENVFPFTYNQTCNQQINFSRSFCSMSFPKLELSVDMWLPPASAVRQLLNNEIHSLSQDMNQLLFANDFSDVVLEVEGQEILAHKIILAARSSVFMAMFKSGMQEDQMSRVKITDIRIEVVREMLRYAYTGEIRELEINANHLMIAADKYNMHDLKNKCRDWILAKLNKDIAVTTLIFADLLKDESLKMATIDFVVSNLSEVMQTPEWEVLRNGHPSLMHEILQAMARQNRSSIQKKP